MPAIKSSTDSNGNPPSPSSPSVHHSFKSHQDEIGVSIKSVYNKLNTLEPNIAAELVRHGVRQLRPLQRIMRVSCIEIAGELSGHSWK